MLSDTQIKRKASAKIKNFVNNSPNKNMQYYYCRGIFHINNIDEFNTAKTICEQATGLKFNHMTQSMCKLDLSQFND